MSKRKKTPKSRNYFLNADFLLNDSQNYGKSERLHESGLFYVKKGRDNNFNGVVLSKHPIDTVSISIQDGYGREVSVPWKTYYFDGDDGREVVITTQDRKKRTFFFSNDQNKLVEKESIFSFATNL